MVRSRISPEKVIAHLLMFWWGRYSENYDEYAYTRVPGEGVLPVMSENDEPIAHLIHGDKREGWFQEAEISQRYYELTGSKLKPRYFYSMADQGIIERSKREYTYGRSKKIRRKNICRLRSTLEAYRYCGRLMLERGLFHEFVDSSYYRHLPAHIRLHYPNKLQERLFPRWQVDLESYGADHPATRSRAETLFMWAPELAELAARDEEEGTKLLEGVAQELKDVFKGRLPDVSETEDYDANLSLILGLLQAGNVIKAYIEAYQNDPDRTFKENAVYWRQEAWKTAGSQVASSLNTYYTIKWHSDLREALPKEQYASLTHKLLESPSKKTDQGGGTKGASKRRKKAAN